MPRRYSAYSIAKLPNFWNSREAMAILRVQRSEAATESSVMPVSSPSFLMFSVRCSPCVLRTGISAAPALPKMAMAEAARLPGSSIALKRLARSCRSSSGAAAFTSSTERPKRVNAFAVASLPSRTCCWALSIRIRPVAMGSNSAPISFTTWRRPARLSTASPVFSWKVSNLDVYFCGLVEEVRGELRGDTSAQQCPDTAEACDHAFAGELRYFCGLDQLLLDPAQARRTPSRPSGRH